MCCCYGYLAPITRLVEEFSHIGIPLQFEAVALANLPPRVHFRPTNVAPIIQAIEAADPGAGVELVDGAMVVDHFLSQ